MMDEKTLAEFQKTQDKIECLTDCLTYIVSKLLETQVLPDDVGKHMINDLLKIKQQWPM